MCYSMSVFTTLRRNCTEHKPGYLHAASQWAHAATATPLQPPHMNVTTNVSGMYLYDLFVKLLHFDSMSTKSVTVKLSIHSKKQTKKKDEKKERKNPKIVFSRWNAKVSEVYNLSALCCEWKWLSAFIVPT